MAKSNKPVVWSLFAAGGTLAALLAPVLALLLLLAASGHPPGLFEYERMQAFCGQWYGRLFLFGVISLFLWHAAHRLRITLFDLGVRQDTLAATALYSAAGAGTLATLFHLLRL